MAFWHDITLGQYIHRESFIHRLDPRTKLLSLGIISSGLIFLKGVFPLLCFCLLLFLTLRLSRIPLKVWFQGFRIFVWFFIIIIFLYSWSGYHSSGVGSILLKYKTGLLQGILAAVRWAILIGFCFILTTVTTPSDLTWALEYLFSPLTKIRVPVHDLSMMAGLALHFLPLLKEEADRIIKVKMMQGVSFDSGSYPERVKNMIGIIPILIHRIFHRSERIALAMEARGYPDKKAEAHHRDVFFEPMSRKDMWVMIWMIIYLFAVWGIERILF